MVWGGMASYSLVPRSHPWKAGRGSGVQNGLSHGAGFNGIKNVIIASSMHCMYTESHTWLPASLHIINYTFCNLIWALRSGSCDVQEKSEHQTLSRKCKRVWARDYRPKAKVCVYVHPWQWLQGHRRVGQGLEILCLSIYIVPADNGYMQSTKHNVIYEICLSLFCSCHNDGPNQDSLYLLLTRSLISSPLVSLRQFSNTRCSRFYWTKQVMYGSLHVM